MCCSERACRHQHANGGSGRSSVLHAASKMGQVMGRFNHNSFHADRFANGDLGQTKDRSRYCVLVRPREDFWPMRAAAKAAARSRQWRIHNRTRCSNHTCQTTQDKTSAIRSRLPLSSNRHAGLAKRLEHRRCLKRLFGRERTLHQCVDALRRIR